MKDEVVTLTSDLVRIDSVATNPAALAKVLALAVGRAKGTVERFERHGFHSVLIHNRPVRPPHFRILLNGHLDIIPGKASQLKPRIEGNRLYGLGAMDMKASVACLIAVFNEVAPQVSYPLGLQLVTDEEIGGFDGTKYQIEEGVRADFVIVAESTGLTIENQMKGILNLTVRATGKAAHGAYPWLGENAIWRLNQFLTALHERFPDPAGPAWVTTVNPSSIRTTNSAFNKVPDEAEVDLNIRFVPAESETVLDVIRALIPAGGELTVHFHEPANYIAPDHPDIIRLSRAVAGLTGESAPLVAAHGTSDARHFAPVGCPAIEFGPAGGGMGSDDEWVDIDSLDHFCRIMKDFLLNLAA
ncbi:MAG: M20/M25/M40 family metallo-hydrolase [Anaerolineales bacterium]|nr:M20/M25/M40 family metallo-hydrolase [Anaerolineales bacterium]